MLRLPIFIAFVCLLPPLSVAAAENTLDEIIVTATKSARKVREVGFTTAILDAETLERIRHTHINETLHRVAGVWISRGNGQEHLTAIRSPVLTGAGSCGAFLMAQDGISLRAPGFCNVNELFEATTELADRIEVIKGPASAVYGSNALHGVVNVLTAPQDEGLRSLSIESGPHDYYRTKLAVSSDIFRLDFSGTTDGGYKDASGFGQQKLVLKFRETTFTYTNLNQETAGFIRGHEAYKDAGSKRDNPNPEAYRDARSYRLTSKLSQPIYKGELSLRPYFRHVEMNFLQHFLPGQALEENGHDSLGLQTLWMNQRGNWQLGLELEYTSGFLKETQAGPTVGSAFLTETIPPGKHYDYEVDADLIGLFTRYHEDINDALSITVGLRYQYIGYDYDNKMLPGRTREDGTPCGSGGCRFNRPADRKDTFSDWSPTLGFIYDLSDRHQVHGSVSRGFRAPQTTELYRLQGGQNLAGIDPVELDAVELGFRGGTGGLDYAFSLFSMNKDNFIFRDTARSNVDNGRTTHRGLELDISYELNDRLSAGLAFTWAKHRYNNNPALSGAILDGNDIDTAPRTLGSASLLWQPRPAHTLELEWVHVGSYYQDPQNLNAYEGHDLLNLRGAWRVSGNFEVFYRLLNIAQRDYAERADFVFGGDRYFVGNPRSVFLGFRLSH